MNASQNEREVVIFEDKAALSRDAAFRFVGLKHQEASSFQPFTVALAGGSTPEMLYRLLAAPPFRTALTWQNVHLFFGDERCVAPDSSDSNFRMANEALIARLDLKPRHVHRMPGELPDPNEAAHRYEEELRRAFHLVPGEVPRFDLILLGLGSDGHCASLFPGKLALHETDRLVVASEPGLKPFVTRLTFTYPVLNNAANVIFLVAGEDKADTLARVLNGPHDPNRLPSQAVRPTNGTLTWLVDRLAAQKLWTGNAGTDGTGGPE